jgi:hypothetical protein
MRKRSTLLGFVAASVIALSAVAATSPADAATSSASAATKTAVPLAGAVVCDDDLCIQRITDVVGGKATVKMWTLYHSIPGHFEIKDGTDNSTFNTIDKLWLTTANYTRQMRSGCCNDITLWEGQGNPYTSWGAIYFSIP